jgi:energy-coupling factor transporter ATP-binding protein EcfA2
MDTKANGPEQGADPDRAVDWEVQRAQQLPDQSSKPQGRYQGTTRKRGGARVDILRSPVPSARHERIANLDEAMTERSPPPRRAKSEKLRETQEMVAKFKPRMNVWENKIEVCRDGGWKAYDDAEACEIRLHCWRLDSQCSASEIDDLVRSEARRHAHHPLKDYIDGLKWDGLSRIDAWLTAYTGALDTPLTRAFARIVLIAAIRRVLKPGTKFDEALVLEGPQGCGKSTAIRILAGEYFTDSVSFGADDKVLMEQLRGKWLAEISELSGLKRGQIEQVKATQSRRVLRARPAYGRNAEEMPAHYIFVGTTNSPEYLRDNTGNRRFWPVNVQRLDLDALARDRDQLWAEAAAREAAGESIELPQELWTHAAQEQQARMEIEPWLEALESRFQDRKGRVLLSSVWGLLGMLTPKDQDSRTRSRLGAVMTRLGFEKKRETTGQRRWYFTNDPADSGRWLVGSDARPSQPCSDERSDVKKRGGSVRSGSRLSTSQHNHKKRMEST